MVLLNYAADFASLPADEQAAVALLFCNVSSQHMGRSWLLYFSRWTMAGTEDMEIFGRPRPRDKILFLSAAAVRQSLSQFTTGLGPHIQ